MTNENAIYCPESEGKALGCIMTEGGNHLAWFLDRGISPSFFYHPENRLIFNAALELDRQDREPTFSAIFSHLRASGELFSGKVQAKLVEFSQLSQGETFRGPAFAVLRDRYLRRCVLEQIRLVSARIGDTSEDLNAATSEHVERLSALWHGHDRKTWGQSVDEAIEAMRNDMLPPDQRKPADVVPFGFKILDRVFCPMETGELVTVAARTSCGKSSFARQVWLSAARSGIPSLLHTLEVTNTELARNLASNMSGVRSRKDLHKLRRDEQQRLLDACAELKTLPAMEVYDDESSLSRMLAAARAFKRRKGLKLWVIDYLGLISDTKDTSGKMNAASQIGKVTATLKQFAQREKIVIVILVQINRAGDECPSLVHLKDSGSIEEDSNRVIIIHRPKVYRTERDGPELRQDLEATSADEPMFFCEVKQLKGRNHGTGEVGMWFRRETASFEEMR